MRKILGGILVILPVTFIVAAVVSPEDIETGAFLVGWGVLAGLFLALAAGLYLLLD